jgi:tRNA dimethylallyltransferase
MILVGGSGLYVDAVLKGLDEFPEVDPSVRRQLVALLDKEGLEPLQKRLRKLDPISYGQIDIQNKQRVIRALEVSEGTGRPFSSFWSNQRRGRSFKSIKIGLRADRELVYQRIDQRVDLMMEEGLLEEARNLYPHRHLNALQTVGYKELFSYFDGTCTLEEAVAEIKKNTRRFAKRQGTWFRRDKDIHWFDYDEDLRKIISFLESRMKIIE